MDSSNVLRPKKLSEIIGQDDIVGRLQALIVRARESDDSLPHMLFTSSPGLGKTTLARAIANEMEDELTEIDLAQLTAKRLPEILWDAGGHLVLLDEIHRAARAQQELLLQWLEEGMITMADGGAEDFSGFSVLACTTHLEKLDDALLSRFQLRFRVKPYSDEAIGRIIEAMAASLALSLPAGAAERLAQAALGVPRVARDLVVAYDILSYSCTPTVEEVLAFVDLEGDGLSVDHIEYLKALRQHGRLGEARLASLTRLHPHILCDVERDLLAKGYIAAESRGRRLTQKGRERVWARP
jgi:Holliday junction DNA helicase RuvB